MNQIRPFNQREEAEETALPLLQPVPVGPTEFEY
jgi:hypothetical protein